jgi:hypothetical protein
MGQITERFSGKAKSRGNYNSDTALRIFDVVGASSEDDAMDQVAAMTGSSLWPAAVGKSFNSSGSFLYCSNVAARDITIGAYEVTATYSIGNFVPPADPTKLPWKYLWKTVTIEPPFDRDINGNPIVNSARCPFRTQPTKRISYKSLTIYSYESFYNYSLYSTYENCVNSDTITLEQPNGNSTQFGPGTIFCVSIDPGNAYTSKDNYLQMVRSFELWDLSLLPSSVTDPFQLQLLDQGSMAYFSSTQRGGIYNSQGEPVSTDQNLNGLGIPTDTSLKVGLALSTPVAVSTSPPGATLLNPTAGAYYLKYKRYNSVPFLPLLTEPS